MSSSLDDVATADPDRPDDRHSAAHTADRRWWWWHLAFAMTLPPVLYAGLRPDSFGLVPNNLDPYFYTGYAINFDDLMGEIRDSHYFVSRWSAYLPSRVSAEVFGPTWGRLVLRWAVASTMLLSLWHLGRRWGWSRSTAVVTGVAVLSTPVFVRAFTTDYVEWVVVSLGFIVVCLSLEPGVSHLRSLAIGTLAAAAVVANPLALPVVALPMLANAWIRRRDLDLRHLAHAVEVVGAGLAVVVAGLLVFRSRYGIPNVYRPTIEFVRDNPGFDDPLRSPRLEWMTAFTWIYLPVLVLAVFALVAPVRRRLLGDPVLRVAAAMLAAQYALHWLDQFGRGGNGLEISYYWSFVFPSLGVVLALLIGLATWTPTRAALFVAAWWVVVVVTRTTELRIPAGWVAIALLGAALAAIAAAGRRSWQGAVAATALTGLAMQVAAPRYDPSAYHPYNMDPLYDQVLYTDAGDRQLEAALWFEERLDTLPDDAGLYFFGTGEASSMMGIYGAHVTGRLLLTEGAGAMAADGLAQVDGGVIPRLVLYGPPDAIAALTERITLGGDRGSVILDEHDGDGLGYRLVVLSLPIPADEAVTWTARSLPSTVGRVDGTARRAAPSDGPGAVVAGPNVYLKEGTYRVTVVYASDAAADRTIGSLEVTRDGELIGSTALSGTGGATLPLAYDVTAAEGIGYEFRVVVTGEFDVVVESVASEPLGP